MIKLKNKTTGEDLTFELTKFPDGTQQAWKINPEPAKMTNVEVLWMYESDEEFFPVMQLGELLYSMNCFPTLNVPYMPFARQDKRTGNNTTFARDLFLKLATVSGYTKIKAYDAHSGSVYVESEEPRALMEAALQDIDVVCFPDKGAKERYSKLLKSINPNIPLIYGDKRRNQQTGAIEGLELTFDGTSIVDLLTTRILVFDDLCDAGGTFIKLADMLKNLGAMSLTLAVSHGLFSKGLHILLDNDYKKIYTTNSLIKNETGWMSIVDTSGKNYGELEIIEVVK